MLTEQHQLAIAAYDELIEQARRAGWPIVFALISSRRSQLHAPRSDSRRDRRRPRRRSTPAAVSARAWSYRESVRAVGRAPCSKPATSRAPSKRSRAAAVGEQIPAILPFFTLLDEPGSPPARSGRQTRRAIDDLLAAHAAARALRDHQPRGTHCRLDRRARARRLGHRDDAPELVAEELAAARRSARRDSSAARSRRRRDRRRKRRYRSPPRSGRPARASPARLQHARALADLGAALRRDGHAATRSSAAPSARSRRPLRRERCRRSGARRAR